MRVERYLGRNAAAESLGGGQRAVVVSTIPLRVNSGSGLAPTSLSLRDGGEAYSPVNPVVPVAIATRPSGGVGFPGDIRVTPIAASAAEAPVVVGNRVVFANAARDSDLMTEPRPTGADISWLLRSQESPDAQGLRFDLPAGAVLRASAAMPGAVEVLEEGKPELGVLPPRAQGAHGEAVRAWYSLTGDVLTTHVDLSGNVAFPVLVDPEVTLLGGYYGVINGANVWNGWHPYNSNGNSNLAPCNNEHGVEFCGLEYYNLIQTGINPTGSTNAWGEWYVSTPGLAGRPGSAGITRVDLAGVSHYEAGQSDLIAEWAEDSHPYYPAVYSWNGYGGASGFMPLVDEASLSGAPIAFCAEEGGGHDGGYPPLCNEESSQARSFLIADELNGAPQTAFNYVRLEGAAVTYREPANPNKVTLQTPGYENTWLKTAPSNWYVEAEDEGLGIAELQLQIPLGERPAAEETVCSWGNNGFTGCPYFVSSPSLNLSGIAKTGVLHVSAVAKTPGLRQAVSDPKLLFIDQTPPVIGAFSGSLAQAENGVIGSGNYTLNISAEDGSAQTWPTNAQSGTRSMEVKVDGRSAQTFTTSCSEPRGEPYQGCFMLSGSWTMSGQAWGVGAHTITVVAKDWAGNESTKSLAVTVNEAPTQSVGPGTVNLDTGAFTLDATDVSISGGTAAFSVSRTYNSRSLSQGTLGPLGQQWALSLPDLPADGQWQRLSVLPNGSVAVSDVHGTEVVFKGEGGHFVSPAGYQTDTLTEPSSSPVEYQLTDAVGNYTRFSAPSGGAFVPSKVAQASGAGGLNPVTHTFGVKEGVTEPTQLLGPEPSPGACTEKLVKGCRALTFSYDEGATTATGENRNEWGEYKGRLSKISFIAWDPAKGAMSEPIPVAQYEWDTKGRLRAEFDPRISPSLKTTYGYDEENHVTAVSSPGQQPWLLQYGTTTSDLNTGRLIAVSRPPATTPLWAGQELKSTTKPALSGTPAVGTKISVNTGSWSNGPLTYAYRWLQCEAITCHSIPGATNPSYTPTEADQGKSLEAIVTATNAGGSQEVASNKSSLVKETGGTEGAPPPAPAPRSTIEYGVPLSPGGSMPDLTKAGSWAQKDLPTVGTAIFPPVEPSEETVGWPASNYKRAKIYYRDSADRLVNVVNPAGGVATTEYDQKNNVTRTLTADDRQKALESSNSGAESEKLDTKSTYSSDGTELVSVLGPEHTIKLPNGTETQARKSSEYFYDEGAPQTGGPYRLVTKTIEGAKVASQPEEDIREVTSSYGGQEGLGWKLHAPTSTTAAPSDLNLQSSTVYDPNTGNATETTRPAGTGEPAVPLYASQLGKSGTEAGQLINPNAVTTDSSGNVWISDTSNNRIDEFNSAGSFIKALGSGVRNGQEEFQVCTSSCKAGLAGAGAGAIAGPQGLTFNASGTQLYVSDGGNNRIDVFSISKLSNGFVKAFGWGVLDGKAQLESCTTGCKAGLAGTGNGQMNAPHGLSFDPSGRIWVADSSNSRLDIFSAEGTYSATYGKQGAGNGEYSGINDVTLCNGNMYAADNAGRVEELSTEGKYVAQFGKAGKETGQFALISRIACNPKNNDLYITDKSSAHVVIYTSAGSYVGTFGTAGNGNGQLTNPIGVTISQAGTEYVVDNGNNRLEIWKPTNPGAGTTQTIYYTAGSEASVENCRNHPEWAGLPCQAQPKAQPETAGLPNLPVTTYTYNIWDEPTTTIDTVGFTTRTATITYDSAGRVQTNLIQSSADQPFTTVTDEYNGTLGVLSGQSATIEGKAKKVSAETNTLGQLSSYTDTDGNTASYTYREDGRIKTSTDLKGSATATYDTTTGLPSGLEVSAIGTFTASYDAEGTLTRETYPNGMIAKYTPDATGQTTNLEYEKTTHCTSNCVWYKDSVVPSIHGQWLTQTTSLSKQRYTYDNANRLTEVQDTPAGEGCTPRLYGFDPNGNRMSLTTRAPGSEGKCATSGGTSEIHTYDTADRLAEPGVTYDPFGNIETLPANDAGGTTLTSSYYVTGRLRSLNQNGQTATYQLDPTQRVRNIVDSGTTASEIINHYDGEGDSPAWTEEPSNGHWTRPISGINGQLAAIQTAEGEKHTTEIQLVNLHGDVIGTAPDNSETETKLTNPVDSTEYGVPRTSTPAKYSWLGAAQRPTELPTGIIAMGARGYIPQLGRFLQPDPLPAGSTNPYGYTNGDPINQADTSGEWAYNYENAQTGAAAEGALGNGIEPGAIVPPPADLQAEETLVAHPPWDAVNTAAQLENASHHTSAKGIGVMISRRALGHIETEECAWVSRYSLYQKAKHSKFYKEQLHVCIEWERDEAEYQENTRPAFECNSTCAPVKH